MLTHVFRVPTAYNLLIYVFIYPFKAASYTTIMSLTAKLDAG